MLTNNSCSSIMSLPSKSQFLFLQQNTYSADIGAIKLTQTDSLMAQRKGNVGFFAPFLYAQAEGRRITSLPEGSRPVAKVLAMLLFATSDLDGQKSHQESVGNPSTIRQPIEARGKSRFGENERSGIKGVRGLAPVGRPLSEYLPCLSRSLTANGVSSRERKEGRFI